MSTANRKQVAKPQHDAIQPNFLFIGAAKCGSSSIRGLLRQHPDLFVPSAGREIRFFAIDELYARGIEWYLEFFRGSEHSVARGECSNHYTECDTWPNASRRIADCLPEARLIYAVREPLDRIRSFWMELRSHGGETVHHSFSTALRSNQGRLIGSSDYRRQLSHYLTWCPRERIHVMFFEDFKNQPAAEIRKCWEFLGLDRLVPCGLEQGEAWKNPSEGKKHAPSWLSRLRRNRIYTALAARLPKPLRRQGKRLIFADLERPVYSPADRRFVLDRIGPNCREFLEEWGKPLDFWDVD